MTVDPLNTWWIFTLFLKSYPILWWFLLNRRNYFCHVFLVKKKSCLFFVVCLGVVFFVCLVWFCQQNSYFTLSLNIQMISSTLETESLRLLTATPEIVTVKSEAGIHPKHMDMFFRTLQFIHFTCLSSTVFCSFCQTFTTILKYEVLGEQEKLTFSRVIKIFLNIFCSLY